MRLCFTAALLLTTLLPLNSAARAKDLLPWQADQGNGQAYDQNAYQPAPPDPNAPVYTDPGAPYQPQPLPRRKIVRRPVVRPLPPPYVAQPAYVAQPSYAPPPRVYAEQPEPQPTPAPLSTPPSDTYGPDDISGAGHRFFGRINTDLASVIEYAFRTNGRPNGYILGEEGGGAFVAGLRYGEGTLFTRNAGNRKVFWQGPSIGYDFGGEGSKTMILVYNLHNPDDVFYDYVGVGGQAYLVGGVGITYLKSGPVSMAPIRSGLGLRIGANVGYLKFTRTPTWNPF